MTAGPEGAPLEESDEVLYRQVVPNWVHPAGVPMSVAFRPTRKDELKVSTDRERATPKGSFERYRERTGSTPFGTWGVSVREVFNAHTVFDSQNADQRKLNVIDDAGVDANHEDHASITYPVLNQSGTQTRKVYERLGNELKRLAITRGLLHPVMRVTG